MSNLSNLLFLQLVQFSDNCLPSKTAVPGAAESAIIPVMQCCLNKLQYIVMYAEFCFAV